jgi:hypothetical protein
MGWRSHNTKQGKQGEQRGIKIQGKLWGINFFYSSDIWFEIEF